MNVTETLNRGSDGEGTDWVALVVSVVLLAAILSTVGTFARIDRRPAALLVPYLLWVGFATALNLQIWRLNWEGVS